MLKWELKKLCTRFTVISVIVLLLANLLTVYILYADEGTAAGAMKREARAELIAGYTNDRDAYDAAYAAYSEQNAAYENWLMYGEDRFIWNNSIIDLENYGDRQLWRDVLLEIRRSEEYGTDIAKVLREAYTRIREMGNRRGEYSYEYQVNIILSYEPLADLQIVPEDILGWNEFFSLASPTVFLTLAVIAVSVQVFLGEKQARFTQILHVSRYGETRTRFAKITAVFISSSLLTALFTLTPLIVLGFTTGLSSGTQVMQALNSFEYCQYSLSIAQYLCIYLAVRIAVFFVLALTAAVLGQITGSFVITFGAMLAFLAVNAILPIGFFTPAFVNYFFERYRAVNFFGLHVNASLFCAVILASVLSVSFIGAVLTKMNMREYRIIEKAKKLLSGMSARTKTDASRKLSAMSCSVFGWEMKKLALNRRSILLILALFAMRCIIQNGYFTQSLSRDDAVYRSYISDIASLGGRVDSVTDAYIAEEGEYISRVTAEYSDALAKYKNGEITLSEFHEYSSRNNYAQSVSSGYSLLLRQQSYLKAMSRQHENIGYADKEGVEKFLYPELDVVFTALLVLLLSDVFSSEYQSGFSQILRLTKNGRKHVLRAKYLAAVLTVSVIWMMFTAADIVILTSRFELNGMSFGMMSLDDFAGIGTNIPIIAYLILCKICGFAGAVLVSVITVSISSLASGTLKSVTLDFIILLSPYLMSVFGMTLFDIINVKHIFAPILPDGLARLAVCLVISLCTAAAGAAKWLGYIKNRS